MNGTLDAARENTNLVDKRITKNFLTVYHIDVVCVCVVLYKVPCNCILVVVY